MCLYKQDSKYAYGPKICKNSEYDKALNMTGISDYASITQRSGYARICLGRVLNMPWILNMVGF